MVDHINVLNIEDPSVELKLQQYANKLKKKYSTKRKVNEKKLLKIKTPFQNFMSLFSSLCIACLFILSLALGFSTAVGKIQKVPPIFAGYSFMTVASGSMKASGFEIYDNVAVKSVNVKTLEVGDIIAFYQHSSVTKQFEQNKHHEVLNSNIKIEYSVSFQQFIGIQTTDLRSIAAATGNLPIIHHIVAVYEDNNGERWFKTKGSSNSSEDAWMVNEKYVIGSYVDDAVAKVGCSLLNVINTNVGMVVTMMIPTLIICGMVISLMLKNVQVAKLELDVVEEKRKLTDLICVNNEVGYNMDVLTKFKVLAQAPENEKEEYLRLLWKGGEVPEYIRKYVLKKGYVLRQNKKLLELNRECEKMFKDGVAPTKIAKHYLEKKQTILVEQENALKKLKQAKHDLKKYGDELIENEG